MARIASITVIVAILIGILYLLFRNMEAFDGGATITYYYLPNCGWCKKFSPVWDEFEEKAKSSGLDVVIRKINGNEASDELKKYNIQGFPHVQLVKGDKVVVFDGARDVKSIIDFVQKNL